MTREPNAKIYEAGNGLPEVGEKVYAGDGIYTVAEIEPTINTGAPGVGNWILARIDWWGDESELTDDEAGDLRELRIDPYSVPERELVSDDWTAFPRD